MSTTKNRLRQVSDFERPSTFLDDDNEDDSLGDINVVFSDRGKDVSPPNTKGKALKNKRWSNLKPKSQGKSKVQERSAPRPKGKESAQDKKRRTLVE
jgi:hypothetical protein